MEHTSYEELVGETTLLKAQLQKVAELVKAAKPHSVPVSTYRQMLEYYKEIGDELKRLIDSPLRNLCSHKYENGEDATVSVPVSCERWCATCKSQFD